MELEALLKEEIEAEVCELNSIVVGSDEYEKTINGIAKLADKAIEAEKNQKEYELKQAQFEDEKRDRKLRNGIAIGGIVIPSIITIWGTMKTFRFEETGTITSSIGRSFINKLLPKK